MSARLTREQLVEFLYHAEADGDDFSLLLVAWKFVADTDAGFYPRIELQHVDGGTRHVLYADVSTPEDNAHWNTLLGSGWQETKELFRSTYG
jgi:hypothetical protein